MAEYTYSIASDTLNGVLDLAKLKLEAQGAGLPVTSGYAIEDVLTLVTSATLDAGQQTTLDGVVAAHDGVPLPVATNHMAVTISTSEIDVANASYPANTVAGRDGSPAGLLGCVLSKPSFFANAASEMGQVLGTMKVVAGGGGEKPKLRVVERQMADDTLTVILDVELEDTGGAFALLSLTSALGALSTGYNEYYLEACLNGATEFKLRGVTVAVVELH